jgi:predicted N-formylglutamate amidohydrolase
MGRAPYYNGAMADILFETGLFETGSFETEPFEIVEARAPTPLLLLCDHAANALPPAYGSLGLPVEALASHIAFDIGAATVTRQLAGAYGAGAVLACFSRLLIDLNRGLDDPTLVMKLSDGRLIPGNAHADAREIARRVHLFHTPYHDEVARQAMRAETFGMPVLISLHSFTPSWKGMARPWDVGVLYDRDRRLADPLMRRLRAAGFVVGDNQPYSGALDGDTMNRHGTRMGRPHVLIEMRQDLIGSETAAIAFAARLKPVVDAALADMAHAGFGIACVSRAE